MYDIAGRGPLCADSLFAGPNGCVPAVQRINSENDNRPKYFEYIRRSDEERVNDPYESKAERSQTVRGQQYASMNGFGNLTNSIRSTSKNMGNML